MPQPALIPEIEYEIEQALAICDGDAIAALRATFIANAFLEARLEQLSASASTGFARGAVKRATKVMRRKEN